MATTAQHVTDADLSALPRDGRKYEWVDGALRVSPAGFRHGVVSVRLSRRLDTHAAHHASGYVLDSSTGYRLPGGNVRSPDVSFVAAGRVPAAGLPAGFVELAPDLAVEVLSPEDRERDVLDKVGECLSAGTRLVTVFRSLTDVRRIDAGEPLDGEDVLPGFTCPLSELLP